MGQKRVPVARQPLPVYPDKRTISDHEDENIKKAVEREIEAARREKRPPDIESAELDAPAGTTGANGDPEVLRAAINHWH